MKCLHASTAAAAALLAVSLRGFSAISVVDGADCSVASNPVVVQSEAYLACQKVTGIDFADKTKSQQDPALFCSSSNCNTLWNQLLRLGALQCLQSYDGGVYRLRQEKSAAECFQTFGKSTTPTPTTPTTATTVKPSTPTTDNSSNNGRDPAGVTGSTPTSSTSTAATVAAAATPSSHTSASTTTTTSGTTTSLTQDSTTESTAGTESGRSTDTASSAIDPATTTTSGTSTVTTVSGDGTPSGGSGRGTGPAMNATTTTLIFETTRTTNKTETGKSPRSHPGGSTSTPTAQSTESEVSSPFWISLGSSVAGMVLVAVLFVVFHRHRERSAASETKDVDSLNVAAGYLATLHSVRSSTDTTSVLGASAVSSSRTAVWDDEVIDAIRIPYEKITMSALISRGGYGEVYKGMYRSQVVAVKTLLPERRHDMPQIRNFFTEVKLMASLEHDHIVRFIGVAWDSLNELCVVTEFVEGGDLRSLLAQYEANRGIRPQGFTADKIKIALHVAHALTYMHSLQPMVLHRDLKSRNILLNDKLDAKVTDFGVSRERVDSTMTIGVGSSLWMAPEVMTGGRYDEKADVFSFGVVLSELDTHTLPYAHALEPGTRRKLPDTVVVQMMTTGRLSVEFTDEEESMIAQLGRKCVALDPRQRPSAAELQHQIHQRWRTTSREVAM